MPPGKVLPAPTQGNGLAEGNSVKLFNQRSPCWLTGAQQQLPDITEMCPVGLSGAAGHSNPACLRD